jgi:hypothetical protein
MTGMSAANSAAMTSAQSAIQNPRPRSGAPMRPIVRAPRARDLAANAFATTSHDDKRIIWRSRSAEPRASGAVWRLPALRF